MGRVGFLIVLWWLASHAAQAQDLTARQHEILRTAIAADGWLTEPLHREFWSAVPAAMRSYPTTIATLVSYLDHSSAVALRFQRATWSSIKLTLAAKRIVKTPDYEMTKAEVLSASGVSQYRAGAERGVRNADVMLEAAATGRSMNGPNGPFYVTEEMVESVLAGLDGSLYRFRKLSNPTWSTQAQEYSFPKEHVRILWDGPFTRETQTTTLEGGKSVPITLLSFRISEHEHVAVGFMRFQGRWLDPQGAGIRTVASHPDGHRHRGCSADCSSLARTRCRGRKWKRLFVSWRY